MPTTTFKLSRSAVIDGKTIAAGETITIGHPEGMDAKQAANAVRTGLAAPTDAADAATASQKGGKR